MAGGEGEGLPRRHKRSRPGRGEGMPCKRARGATERRHCQSCPAAIFFFLLQKYRGRKLHLNKAPLHCTFFPTSFFPLLSSEATHPNPCLGTGSQAGLPGEGAFPTPAPVWDSSLEPEAAGLVQAGGTVGCTRLGLP
jgi:hypothetical protein